MRGDGELANTPNSAQTAEIVLSKKLDTAAATDLFEALRPAGGCDVRIDAAQVEHLGAQCLQMLLLFSRSVRGSGASVSISRLSGEFKKSVRDLGFKISDVTGGGAA